MPELGDVGEAIAALKGTIPGGGETPAVLLPDDDAPVLRDLKNGLAVAYFIDEGNRFRYVAQRDLDRHRLDAEQLHAVGLKNLLKRIASRTRVQAYQDVHAVFVDGNFEASLLLLDQIWEKSFRPFVKGEYAVAVPARDVLAFGDAGSPAVIQQLGDLIGRVFPGGDHLLSDRIYLRTGGLWKQRPV